MLRFLARFAARRPELAARLAGGGASRTADTVASGQADKR